MRVFYGIALIAAEQSGVRSGRAYVKADGRCVLLQVVIGTSTARRLPGRCFERRFARWANPDRRAQLCDAVFERFANRENFMGDIESGVRYHFLYSAASFAIEDVELYPL